MSWQRSLLLLPSSRRKVSCLSHASFLWENLFFQTFLLESCGKFAYDGANLIIRQPGIYFMLEHQQFLFSWIHNKRLIILLIPVKACFTVECCSCFTFWYVKQQQVVSKSCLNFLGTNSRLSIKKDKVKTALKTFIFSCIKFHFKVYRDKREKEYRIRFQLRDFSTECKKCAKLKSTLSTLKTDMKDSYVFHNIRQCLVYRYGCNYIFLF